jgi:hypothetical protein
MDPMNPTNANEATDETDADESEAEAQPYPLAFDAEGEPLDVPPEAARWRVRKLAARAGRPRNIFDPDTGRQLELPITATIHDLAERVDEPGRYRLEAVDRAGRHLVGCVAITEVCPDENEKKEIARSSRGSGDSLTEMTAVVRELVSANTRVMEAMASAFGRVRPAPAPLLDSPPPQEKEQQPQAPDPSQGILTVMNQLMAMIAQVKAASQAAPSPQA